MRQRTWELWFITSATIFVCLSFVGLVDGSMKAFPNFLWGFVPSLFNLFVCLYYGTKPTKR